MEYWDSKGQIHNDSTKQLTPQEKAYNKFLSGYMNVSDWINETNPESKAYKQKVNTIEGIEALLTPTAFANQKIPRIMMPTEKIIEKFFTNPKTEESPDLYKGERSIKAVLDYLGNNGKIKTPVNDVAINKKGFNHFLFENNPERLEDLGKVKRTFEKPDLIIQGQREGKDYNYFAKPFKHNKKVRGHLNIAEETPNGNLYTTNFNLRANKLRELINNGQIIQNNLPLSTAPIFKNMPVNNIIQQISKFFNP